MDESTSPSVSGQTDPVELTTSIIAAYVANNSVPVSELPALLSSVHAAITGLGGPAASGGPQVEKPTPVQIRKSIRPEALISFIDGKPYKTLKRHLTGNGMSMEEYRERYGLPRDYPSTAASYSEQRSALAKAAGLGQQRRNAAAKAVTAAETVTDAPKASGRKKAVEPAKKPARARKPKKATTADAE
ncbi:putative transcriptional regulator [Methylobacterium sp. PvP062]|uniref:Transcriptional regulator n=1 Tax=Methylobacterium radiotolerans TaxID=31998 RepID=A0ABV2NU79_9HYPH|nr:MULTISPECIES: MucR family transcriptional regulator [unclassified Methylobacterium]MBP2498329.1 putative transcriptional regulator [Methylobacterium sp. PvP105]MBP2505713.1 putative transcriptional regulator [Methylobacterium sp. PvP109]